MPLERTGHQPRVGGERRRVAARSAPDRWAARLAVFVVGVLAAALASGVTYLSQWSYAGEPSWQKRTGLALNIAAILVGLSAYGVFAFGVWQAYRVFLGFGS
jgi:hypothetical protein